MTVTETSVSTQTYRVWIKATPEAIWDAITKPELTDRYGYGGLPEYGDMQPGTSYRIVAGPGMESQGFSGTTVEGELLEVEAPRRFRQTWKLVMAPELASEPPTPVTYDLEPIDDNVTRLTLTHELDGAPLTAAMVSGADENLGAGGGWAWILSDLKTLLETGTSLNNR